MPRYVRQGFNYIKRTLSKRKLKKYYNQLKKNSNILYKDIINLLNR